MAIPGLKAKLKLIKLGFLNSCSVPVKNSVKDPEALLPTLENISLWRESVYATVSLQHNLFIRYGFGAIALISALSLHFIDASPLIIALAFIAATSAHMVYRYWFVWSLTVPVDFEKVRLERDKHMRDIEEDPQLRAMGIYVEAKDWPKIMELVLRRSVLQAYENLISKSVSAAGYIAMFLALVHSSYA